MLNVSLNRDNSDRGNSIGRFTTMNLIWISLFALLAGLVNNAWGADSAIRPGWDKDLLSVKLGDVQIQANTMAAAWQEITTKYLLRANLYMDAAAISDETPFAFHEEKATGKELFDALLATYPEFTYTQNPETGIIWFHPKRVSYSTILNQRVGIAHGASEIPMYTGIYVPLLKLLAPNVIDSSDAREQHSGRSGPIDPSTGKPPIPASWLYDVDLPPGVYSARELLDFCCAANPTKSFLIRPVTGQQGPMIIFLEDLCYFNPLVPPRAGAIRFWEIEINKPTNGVPSLEEVRAAMGNPDPAKRSAACLYLESSMMNYSPLNLFGNADDPEQAVWTALGVEYALSRGSDANFFIGYLTRHVPRFREDLTKITNPNLALLASLQLARENQDTTYLDAVVSKHTYTEEEIASIQPELDRMARSSKAVRDKLKEMKSQVPELSPEVLDELANTNFFELVPPENN